jgi:undecaprenyl-diphosphatase
VLLVGAGVLAASVAGALRPDIHPGEQRVFRAVNDLPDWLYRPLWVPMQVGNLVVGCLAGLLVAWWYGDWPTAAAVLVATALKLVAERVVRARMGRHLAVRQRPGTSEPGARLRGDVPAAGPSFPSGHVVLVAAVAVVLVEHLGAVLGAVPFALTVLVMVGRVYVGAHNPLDVTAGLGLGLVVGGLLGVGLR